jgi:D-alanyl-D-alanine carboxypeptidase
MYGRCDVGEVTSRLKSVEWLPKHHGGTVQITSINNVDAALAAVSKELDELPENYLKYLIPTAGTYNCRTIAGTSRKSMHAYGAAIDINTKFSSFWRWSMDKNEDYKYENKIPYEIAAIFEKHGFIWGAKWYHFDTMHFEYRPELLAAP